ncbi:MAG TPA: inorganic phosphate transporter, partial [Candidatus Binatia bacterium]|nr:inorganic phosphate transporter [Candidatus Binatia bacterium]
THSLTGAFVGSGLVAVGFEFGFRVLATGFILPLLISPVLAAALAAMGYPLLSRIIRRAGLTNENCLCVAGTSVPAAVTSNGMTMTESLTGLRLIMDQKAVCSETTAATVVAISAERLLDIGHYLSAGAVGFARGLNDTPKLIALGLVGSVADLSWFIILVAVIMALGGLLNAKNVAETVSKRITAMQRDQGFWANLVTSFLVIFASKWGMPVSTTHVSCGALFGIGIANGQARWEVIRTILLAWLLTLPLAAISAALIYAVLSRVAVL